MRGQAQSDVTVAREPRHFARFRVHVVEDLQGIHAIAEPDEKQLELLLREQENQPLH